ncbi:MAG: DarT ssDNA thymidine ADP-ribosyltransferase family protein [Candidatus Thorarchaeota archaeon]
MKKEPHLTNTYICRCGYFKRVKKNKKINHELSPLKIKLISDVESFLGLLKSKGIKYFNFLTHLDNLVSICMKGILSRNKLLNSYINFKDISKNKYRQLREKLFSDFFPEDDVYNYVPLYISSHTRMFRKISSYMYKYYAVLKIDPYLFFKMSNFNICRVKISNSSINQKYTSKDFRIMNLFENLNIIDNFLEWNILNTDTHHYNAWKGQKKSAEILIPDMVLPNYIAKICPKCGKEEFNKYLKKKNQYLFEEYYEKVDFENKEFIFKDEVREVLEIDVSFFDDIEFDDIDSDLIDSEMDLDIDELDDSFTKR